MRVWQWVEMMGCSDGSGSTQPFPPTRCSLRCLEDCGHGVCSGPPDFTCVCDLGWTSDLPPPTPAPGPPAPRCSRDCGCSFHSHCRRRGPGYCDECQGKPSALSLMASLVGTPSFSRTLASSSLRLPSGSAVTPCPSPCSYPISLS